MCYKQLPTWTLNAHIYKIHTHTHTHTHTQVVHSVGLCIALHDITHVGDAYIFPGDGASHTKGQWTLLDVRPCFQSVYMYTVWQCVHKPSVCECARYIIYCMCIVRFRFVVFRPFINEVLVGRIRSCTQEGVRGEPPPLHTHTHTHLTTFYSFSRILWWHSDPQSPSAAPQQIVSQHKNRC